MFLSRLRSATSCVSSWFSSSSCFTRRHSPTPSPQYIFFQRQKVCSEMLILRIISATGVPVSDCLSAKAICLSCISTSSCSSSLPEGSKERENFHSSRAERQGGRQVNVPFAGHATGFVPPGKRKCNWRSSTHSGPAKWVLALLKQARAKRRERQHKSCHRIVG